MGITSKLLKHALQAYGPALQLAYARWTPSGSSPQTITDAGGVSSITRTSAGLYVVNLSEGCKAIVYAHAYHIEDDATTFHFTRVQSTAAASKTITVSHKSVVYASIASGPTASDTVDELCVWALVRRGT
jgi:hypothetical protein